MKKINIVEAGNELGLGGTEYTIQLYSKYLNKDMFNLTVVALREGGPRVNVLKSLGITVLILNGDMKQFGDILDKTDVLHWHGYGTLDPEVFNTVRAHKPALVVQTNVFGGFTNTDLYSCIDFDLFVSKMILIRRMLADGPKYQYLMSKRKVLHNPVDCDEIDRVRPSETELKNFKLKYNLQDNFIIGRVGRADNAKFDLLTLDAYATFSNYYPESKFLLVGATPEILAHAEKLGIKDTIVVCETTIDFKELILYYSAIDIFLALSDFGETFGMSIAEAMYVGVPVVTISTPEKDNAQVEVVDNGVNGFVSERNTESLVHALSILYHDKHLRDRFSASGKTKIKEHYNAVDIVKSLENLIASQNNAQSSKLPTKIISIAKQMIDDYFNRCENLRAG